jgi:hypothetical protein
MITSGGKRKPTKPDLGLDTRSGRGRISAACQLAMIRRCNSAEFSRQTYFVLAPHAL